MLMTNEQRSELRRSVERVVLHTVQNVLRPGGSAPIVWMEGPEQWQGGEVAGERTQAWRELEFLLSEWAQMRRERAL